MTQSGRSAPSRMVVVGGSLAGLRAAEELRHRGFAGSVTVIGDEETAPYDRPPLSKAMLTAGEAPAVPYLAHAEALDVEWMLGVRVVALDLAAGRVHLADGRDVGFDRVLVATGRRARAWPVAAEATLDGVLTLRTLEDAVDLRERLLQSPRRVVIIGAGFIGSEVASSCRELGLEVSVVARGFCPLDGALGQSVGAWAAELYARHGVDLHAASSVESIRGDAHGYVSGVQLSDGGFLTADLVVIATGSVPNVDWLESSGLDVDGGVAVDGALRALTMNGVPCPNVFAAGDVARWGHPFYRNQLLAIEHWGNALEQGRYAARSMISEAGPAEPFIEIPRFWSTMFGANIKSVGVPSFADEVMLVQGSPANLRGVFLYGREGRCVAGVSFDAPRELATWEPRIVSGEAFPPQGTVPDWGRAAPPEPVPARFPLRGTTRPQCADGATSATLAASGHPEGAPVGATE
ncbi:NAD(P)/FAD-dependent oxidoreductase [Brevibacterium marinum]|uniref:3-phenylpropionate/trans-cinnamate dioxygenase ferredoxin reductase subunit n=1 Tax=Brevibacterium marinum TaxID=418643 RepID=A0A846S6I5_9MICO|nr:FAD-dependent oxidoreductase [Brevibacterium marinum]NJC56447.1 3-phenylpropionate/trans-cinnamate dioxygenase ferredoxin reductase subunit [Brevibacterium marinum]